MIRTLFIAVFGLGLLAGLPLQVQAEDEVSLSLPPASLGQWYKPRNKRQVWLHTMFGMRRAMQAISDYIALEDAKHLRKWTGRLAEAYRSIPKMVPEWKDELDLDQLQRLEQAVQRVDYAEAGDAQRKLGHSCNACHREYQAVARAIYRSPDFSQVRVEDSESLEEVPYRKVMQRLSTLVNRVKIASEDGRKATARDSVDALGRWLDDLSGSCSACHRDPAPVERVLGQTMRARLDRIGKAVDAGDRKALGRGVAELAVETCARCHGVHRTLYDLRRVIVSP